MNRNISFSDSSTNDDSNISSVQSSPPRRNSRKVNEWTLMKICQSYDEAQEWMEENGRQNAFQDGDSYRRRNKDDGRNVLLETFYCPIGGRPAKVALRTCLAMVKTESSHDDQTVIVYRNQFPHTHVPRLRGMPLAVKRLMRKGYRETKGAICSVNKMKPYLRANGQLLYFYVVVVKRN